MRDRKGGVWVRRCAALLLSTILVVACDDAVGTGPTPPGPAPVASVTVAPKEGAWSGTLKVGQTVALAAKPLAADGAELPTMAVAWASTDTAVAIVNAAGVVEAKKAGTAEVTAAIGGRVGRILVVVTVDAPPPPAEGVATVKVSPQAAILEIGQTRQYAVRVFDAEGNELLGRTVAWSTTTPQVVSVSATGEVRALAAGYGEVVATVEGRKGAAAVTVATP